MSFILDALRKSEHERQRAAVPGLSQVPLAVPQPEMPRWAIAVIGVLAAAVLALGVAWWQSLRPQEPQAAASTVERPVELPPAMTTARSALVQAPAQPSAAEPTSAPARPSAPDAISPSGAFTLERAAASSVAAGGAAAYDGEPSEIATTARAFSAPPEPRADVATLPSAAALAAEGVALPALRLELHAFSAEPRNRFVFINGRKYVEGDRLVEGPQLVSIEPTGAVLAHAGRQFLLVQE